MHPFLQVFLIVFASVGVPLCSSVYQVSDIAGLGRRFDGIGGLSGGGATSKLLVNYPYQQRQEILDYLFKPNFGASLHILKVEIGGDAQSTDGTEASHMHNRGEENYNRGYEWWLMKEAKKRNPDIKLYGLPWGFPGWLGDGSTSSPYGNVTQLAEYIVKWIRGAKLVHDLTIDYVGIWNERSYSVPYIKTLRKMLDAAGCVGTRIVAADGNWGIADDVLADKELAEAVDCLGCHYPGTYSDNVAMKTGKQLWASEDYSTYNDRVGGGCWARILNQNYVNGYMTSTISWNLIASYYNPLPYFRDGLMTAVEPWGGNYIVETPIWVSAHTTQFTSVGWTYLQHGSGVGHLDSGGSFVTLASPDLKDITIVVETMSHNNSLCIRPSLPAYNVTAQMASFALNGSFKHVAKLNVWVSKLDPSGGMASMFQQRPPIKVANGLFMLKLGVDELYTLTTVPTGKKGQFAPPPPSQPFPLPYKDDFQNYSIAEEPFNLVPQSGSYEVVEVAPSVKCLKQTVLQHPVSWCGAEDGNTTLALIGNYNWTDIEVQVDYALDTMPDSANGVFLGARIRGGGCSGTVNAQGIFLSLFPQCQTFLLSLDIGHTEVFAGGRLPFPSKACHAVSLTVKGDIVEPYYDGKMLISAAIPKEAPKNGFVGLGTTSWGVAYFDNLAISNVKKTEEKQHPLRSKSYQKVNAGF